MIFDGFNEDGTGINLDHDHDVVITCLRAVWKFPGLVSEDGVAGVDTLVKMSRCLRPWSCRDRKSSNGAALGLVECTFFQVWLR